MQAVIVFKETCRCFDVFQFRAGCRALAKFRLYAQSLVVVRFDKINPYCIYKGVVTLRLPAGSVGYFPVEMRSA